MPMQAFIFCDQGDNLWPFSQGDFDDDVSNNGITKALLPVGNRSMLNYVLDWCDQANFKEINVVGHVRDIDEIQRGLQAYLELRHEKFMLVSKALSGSQHLHHLQEPRPIKFIESRANSTGECLQKELLERINGDFVLLPCDFITDIPPQVFIDQYRHRDFSNLAMTFYYQNVLESTDKKQQAGERFFTIYSGNEDVDIRPVLLDVYSMGDVEKTKYLQVRTHLLWNYPNATVSTKLENSSVYFCSHELCRLLLESKSNHNDVNDNDHDDYHGEHLKEHEPEISDTMIKPAYFKRENRLLKDPLNCNKPLCKVFRDLARRSWKHSSPRETIGMFLLPQVGFFVRANNLHTFTEANRFVLKIKAQALATNTQITTASASAIGADAVIGNNCTILEKSNIKLSAVGPDCRIGNRCRIAGSILLRGVTIEDEVILENVVIGTEAVIGKKSKLTNCYVEGYYHVDPKSNLKGETVTKLGFESDESVSSNAAESSSQDESFEEEYDDEFQNDGLFDH